MNNRGQRIAIAFILLIILILSSSTVSGQEITDTAGRTVEVPSTIERIIAVGPGAVRLMVYLQAGDMLVGVEDFEKDDKKRPYLLANPELAELSSIGPQFGGDPELIAAARPDIIFCTYFTAAEADSLQQKTDLPVVVLVEGTAGTMYLEDLSPALKLAADLLQRQERAEEILDFYEKTTAELEKRTGYISGEDRITAYIGGIGQRGAKGIVSTEPAYLPFQYANIENAAAEIGMTHALVDPEKLLEWNPEYLFIDQGGRELAVKDLKERKYNYLRALKEERVYGLLPYNYYSTNFATLLANSYYLGKTVYPNYFEDVEPSAKADEIYNFFVGDGVYEEMADIFGGYNKINITAEIE